ncbi:MAG: transposase [Candidatus Synoicihabitans palmerolidicus]|nr:transposase [Candidatus Synoicihabitans palmerolidicus]
MSSSPWNHHSLMDQVACDANTLFGDEKLAGLYIDERSFLEKGHASVGVQRQWSGRAGKVENCQVGVYACLGRDTRVCLTDFRLYLPEAWTQDSTRLDKAKVPEQCRVHKTKHEQAWEMIVHARKQGLRFGWVGFDCLYGKLLNAVEDLGGALCGRCGQDDQGMDATTTTGETARGPGTTREELSAQRGQHRTVSQRGSIGPGALRIGTPTGQIPLRHQGGAVDSDLGEHRRTWEPGTQEPRERLLIIRRDADNSFKYSLSNRPAGRPVVGPLCLGTGPALLDRTCLPRSEEPVGHGTVSGVGLAGWHHHMA